MEEKLWNVDEIRYQDYCRHTLLLKGWFLGITEDSTCFLADETGRQELAKEIIRRPDVAANYPDHPDALLSGFEIRIPEAWDLAEGQGKVRVFLETGETGQPVLLWEMGKENLKQLLTGQLLSWHVDKVCLQPEGTLLVLGWAFCQRGEGKLRLLDARGNETGAALTWTRREDVADALELPEFCSRQIGFCLELKGADKISSPRLLAEFSCEYARDVYEIGLKRYKMEQTPMGRVRLALAPSNTGKNLRILKDSGPAGFFRFLQEEAGWEASDYEHWMLRHRPGRGELKRQRKTIWENSPLLSIVVPLYNTPLPLLKALVDSVTASSYRNWQLCLADGSQGTEVEAFCQKHYRREKRIVYQKLERNLGISGNTNAAAQLSTGDYLLFADHDDMLTPDALFEIAAAIRDHSSPDVIYSDEDKVSFDGKHYMEPNFKPDLNLFRLRDNNYICHLFAVKRELWEQTGGLRSGFDGAQDYDLILRCVEKAGTVYHIPRVLYHWRTIPGSTSMDPGSKRYAYEAGQRALEEHYRRLGIKAEVSQAPCPGWYRSRVAISGTPLVSVIIPTKDHAQDLKSCVTSIFEKTTYPCLEILVVDNGSTQEEIFSLYQEWEETLPGGKVRVLHDDKPFNFSEINNFAVSRAKGEYLLFLNNDVEVLTPEWIEEMLMICQQPSVAAVGAKLYYPDHTIQHAGVILGMGGIAGHLYCTGSGDAEGYMGRLISVQELSAVTAACMMVKRASFEAVGGYDESLAVAFNDVDLCMKLRKNGEKVVFTPYAELTHYESKSRGPEDTPAKQKRFLAETARFREKWGKELREGDPAFSPNLSLEHGYCALKGTSVELK